MITSADEMARLMTSLVPQQAKAEQEKQQQQDYSQLAEALSSQGHIPNSGMLGALAQGAAGLASYYTNQRAPNYETRSPTVVQTARKG